MGSWNLALLEKQVEGELWVQNLQGACITHQKKKKKGKYTTTNYV